MDASTPIDPDAGAGDASPPGGSGGDHRRRIHDVRLAERALRERWDIPDAIRPALVKRLARTVLDRESSPREATAAARALLEASRINLESVRTTIVAEQHEELDQRLRELEQKVNPP